ncbi:hypothetical protein Y032_0491g2395 [Ancylostoma ceylanicum]|uniref:Uncharacterized protein n=1 Tax=Ancylostoma ceylanicum TaxID=53326 RepID=A0A016WW75_9BILA|nr:hypothetical protein Y032_0491g2395 [Ancylostoma ceylanicum]
MTNLIGSSKQKWACPTSGQRLNLFFKTRPAKTDAVRHRSSPPSSLFPRPLPYRLSLFSVLSMQTCDSRCSLMWSMSESFSKIS